MSDKMREEYNAWYAKEIGVLGTGQCKAWFRPWAAAREKPFADAVACVFDNLKFAACNTSGKEWSEELEDLAEEVIEFAPQYKRQWKDICELSARVSKFEAIEIELPFLFPAYRQEVIAVLEAAGLKVKPC